MLLTITWKFHAKLIHAAPFYSYEAFDLSTSFLPTLTVANNMLANNWLFQFGHYKWWS